ncbi:MAG TPA: transposase [Candidatus Limnocylindria bacterium]|nr:transposase [Candidatus Limnocylindria bacterium]
MIWIGIDAHKRVHQAVAISEQGVVGTRTIPNTPQAWAALLEWAGLWPERTWAVEDAWYLGRGLAQHLAERSKRVHEVNGRWTAARRRGMRRPGKSDRRDAHSVAQLLREEADTLPRVYAEDDAQASVQLWSRLQAELTKDMTRVVNRLHDLLLAADAEYRATLPALTQPGIAAVLAYVAPGEGALARERERAIRATADQLRLLDEQDRELRRKLARASKARFPPLRETPESIRAMRERWRCCSSGCSVTTRPR